MDLLHVARVPAIVARPESTVHEAIVIMAKAGVGAIVITDADSKVLGIFTERDNMIRITMQRRDPDRTKLSEVMSSPIQTASPHVTPAEALQTMLEHKYRHLPIVDRDNRILGVVSVRLLLMRRVSEQQGDIDILEAYTNAGGPG